MNTHALLYRPASQWTTWAGLFCATAIFAVAICLGRTQIESSIAFAPPGDSDTEVFLVGEDEEPTPVAEDHEPEVLPPPTSDEAFPEENIEPRKVVSRRTRPIARTVAPASNPGTGSNTRSANTAIFAPRPDYPYEARRQSAIGTGLVSLTIDRASGVVTDACMKRSTGRPILDASAVRAFGRWRFRPGAGPIIDIPITFTLTGASY